MNLLFIFPFVSADSFCLEHCDGDQRTQLRRGKKREPQNNKKETHISLSKFVCEVRDGVHKMEQQSCCLHNS